MDQVGEEELHYEGGGDIAEEDGGLWGCRADEIESGGENDHVEDVIYCACDSLAEMESPGWRVQDGDEECSPKSQKAMQTRRSAPRKMDERRAWYIAQEADWEPGRASMAGEGSYPDGRVMVTAYWAWGREEKPIGQHS